VKVEEVPSHLDHARRLVTHAANEVRQAPAGEAQDLALLALLRLCITAMEHGATADQLHAWTGRRLAVVG
jgi:hypothetical protein